MRSRTQSLARPLLARLLQRELDEVTQAILSAGGRAHPQQPRQHGQHGVEGHDVAARNPQMTLTRSGPASLRATAGRRPARQVAEELEHGFDRLLAHRHRRRGERVQVAVGDKEDVARFQPEPALPGAARPAASPGQQVVRDQVLRPGRIAGAISDARHLRHPGRAGVHQEELGARQPHGPEHVRQHVAADAAARPFLGRLGKSRGRRVMASGHA